MLIETSFANHEDHEGFGYKFFGSKLRDLRVLRGKISFLPNRNSRAHPGAQFLRQPQVFAVVHRAGHYGWDLLPECFLENGLKLLRCCDFIAPAAEGLREGGKIRIAEVDEGWPPVALQLLPFDDPISRIFEDERDKIRFCPHCRFQFLHTHKKSAVTADR